MKTIIAILSRLTDHIVTDPLRAARIKYTLADMHADFIARRITGLEGILSNLRDQQALCDRAADLAYEELEKEELNALLREHREFLDREAVVTAELDDLRYAIEEIENRLARRGAL